MSRISPNAEIAVDLLQLLNTGKIEKLVFGETRYTELEKLLQDDETVSREGMPWVSWSVATHNSEFYFHGYPPRLYGLKLKVEFLGMGFTPGRCVTGEITPLKSGNLVWHLDNLPWTNLETLPHAIHHLESRKKQMEISSSSEKQIFLMWSVGGRNLSLEYALKPLERENGIYEFDYYLQAVRLSDDGLKKELEDNMSSPDASEQ